MNNDQKLEKFFKKELNSNLQEVFITRDFFGNFELFNKFKIETQSNGLFKVIPYNYTEERVFSTLKNAFAWCVFRKLNRLNETNRIEQLDHMLDSLETIITQQKRVMSKSKDIESKYIYMAKLNEAKLKKNAMLKELKSYINISRQYQVRKFLQNQPK